jgi:hypothetical protein
MSDWTDDDQLLEELARALAQRDDVPDRARQAARAAFAWRTIDSELMELEHDSALTRATVRGAGTEKRIVAYRGRGLSIELEVAPGTVIGQVVPGRSCRVVLEQPDAERQECEVGEDGLFAFHDVAPAALRLVVVEESGRSTTRWLP